MLKKIAKIVLVVIFIISTVIQTQALEADEISAKSAALMVADTRELLFGKNEYAKLSMASTTKIMTALLALESGEPNRTVKITKPMIQVEGTSIGLKEGECVPLCHLISGMLLESGNDAANATACAMAGSIDKFVEMMNQKVSEIGMTNTHFVTPSGLDDNNHFSCAYDMTLLGSYAINNPSFRDISSQKTMRATYGEPACTHTFSNHNRMLKTYPGAVGIKTGFTKKSGRCLVSAAERDGVTLVAVTLNAPNDWDDHKKLLDYGFSKTKSYSINFSFEDIKLPVISGTEKHIKVYPQKDNFFFCSERNDFKETVFIPHFIYAPITKGEQVGELRITDAENNIIKSVPLLAESSVSEAKVKNTEIRKTFTERVKSYLKKDF